MSNFAILLTGEPGRPAVVRLAPGRSGLELATAQGMERVAWWRLYRVDADRSTHRFRRVDRRDWELRVMSGADQDLLAHIGRRPVHRILHPLRRLHALKVVAGLVVLIVTVAQHAPVEWVAKSIPDWAGRRLMDGVVASNAPIRCAHDGGEAAVRELLVRLDPEIGRKVDVVAVRESGFVVTSAPGDHIFLYHGSMSEIDARALPALLAHELSHIRHRDPITAVLRRYGFIATWSAILDGAERRRVEMQFSGLEERRADLEAMAMMRHAGMPLKPAADMFEKMRVSKEQGGFFGYDQRDFHYGIDARARRWAEAARADPPRLAPTLSRDEEDALFNYCWSGPIAALPEGAARAPPRMVSAGRGRLGVHNNDRTATRKAHLTSLADSM